MIYRFVILVVLIQISKTSRYLYITW